MIKENKELLLRDLCSRLPYGVKCKVWYNDKTLDIKCTGIDFYTNTVNLDVPGDDNAKVYVDNIKPYLFPLSSMTEEQKKEFSLITCDLNDSDYWRDGNMIYVDDKYQLNNIIDFYHKNHLDYRCLIPMGLAIDATDKNVY